MLLLAVIGSDPRDPMRTAAAVTIVTGITTAVVAGVLCAGALTVPLVTWLPGAPTTLSTRRRTGRPVAAVERRRPRPIPVRDPTWPSTVDGWS
jgi:hypothetical protein